MIRLLKAITLSPADQLNEGPVDWEIDEIGCEKFNNVRFDLGFKIPLRDIMETTKELLKLDALIGKNPFERTLPKV